MVSDDDDDDAELRRPLLLRSENQRDTGMTG